jgi:hypothetical protein
MSPGRSAAFLVNIGRMGGISKEKLEELLKSYNKNAIITTAIHAGDRRTHGGPNVLIIAP